MAPCPSSEADWHALQVPSSSRHTQELQRDPESPSARRTQQETPCRAISPKQSPARNPSQEHPQCSWERAAEPAGKVLRPSIFPSKGKFRFPATAAPSPVPSPATAALWELLEHHTRSQDLLKNAKRVFWSSPLLGHRVATLAWFCILLLCLVLHPPALPGNPRTCRLRPKPCLRIKKEEKIPKGKQGHLHPPVCMFTHANQQPHSSPFLPRSARTLSPPAFWGPLLGAAPPWI